MKMIYACYQNLGGTPHLEAYTDFSRQEWATWLAESNPQTLLELLEAAIQGIDFSFGKAGGVLFPTQTLESSVAGYINRDGQFGTKGHKDSIPPGFVGFFLENRFTAIVPACSYFGFLTTISANFAYLEQSAQAHYGPAFSWDQVTRKVHAIENEIGKLITKCSNQGRLTFRNVESNRTWGKIIEIQTCFEPKDEWLPFLNCEYLFDKIYSSGAILSRSAAGPSDTDALDNAIRSRCNFLDTLRIARLYGKPIPEDIYSPAENSRAHASRIVQSYHRLLAWYSNPAEQDSATSLASRPFSIDWYYHLEKFLPPGIDSDHLNHELELIWSASETSRRETRDIQVLGCRLGVIIDDLGDGNFGYASLCYAEELD